MWKGVLRKLPLLLVITIVLTALVYGLWPVPVDVDIAVATRGPLRVTVNDDGRTRIREKYVVSAPVFGKLLRVELEEGDAVYQGETALARIEPRDPDLLDARAVAEAEARVRAAEASVRQAEAVLQHAEEARELAGHDYERALELVQRNAISASDFDATEHRERMAQADVRSAEFGVTVAKFELDLAKAALVRTQPRAAGDDSPATMTILSPVGGRVLQVLQENAGIVTPGTPLLEIGDPNDLEMVIDVLSTDAVKIQPGANVIVEHWGGDGQLEGVVRLVEPSAFLKVSALGVEEQRVNVIADFTSPFAVRQTLGDEYRIEASIVVDEALDVVQVPTGVLLRENDRWQVFRVVNRRASLQFVETGGTNELQTEIVTGVSPQEVLILHPTDKIRDGTSVRWE